MLQFWYDFIGRMFQFHVRALDLILSLMTWLNEFQFDEMKAKWIKAILLFEEQFPIQTATHSLKNILDYDNVNKQ